MAPSIKKKKPIPNPDRLLPNGLARALANNKSSVDSESLLRDLIEVWGGTRRLAVDMHEEFVAAGKGGMTRQRILEMLQRLIINNTNHEIGKIAKPSDMDDSELEALALAYMKKVVNVGSTEKTSSGG